MTVYIHLANSKSSHGFEHRISWDVSFVFTEDAQVPLVGQEFWSLLPMRPLCVLVLQGNLAICHIVCVDYLESPLQYLRALCGVLLCTRFGVDLKFLNEVAHRPFFGSTSVVKKTCLSISISWTFSRAPSNSMILVTPSSSSGRCAEDNDSLIRTSVLIEWIARSK